MLKLNTTRSTTCPRESDADCGKTNLIGIAYFSGGTRPAF